MNIFSGQNKPIKILAVEDEELSMCFLESQIQSLGHEVVTATNGQMAIDILQKNYNDIDVIIMDRHMPIMDGMEAIKRIKDDSKLKNMPIIMVTGADSVDETRDGLNAGVFYYLAKPVKEEILQSVLMAALREADHNRTLSLELQKHRASFGLIDTCRFNFKTLDEAKSLSAFIANCFKNPNRVVGGIGALLMNAVEHGNLDIGYDKKSELIAQNLWMAEIEKRQLMPEYKDKSVTATISHKNDGAYIIIEDMGRGFDWKKYIEIDPVRASHSNGRGIAQAKQTSFDKLTFNDTGNQAVAFVKNAEPFNW